MTLNINAPTVSVAIATYNGARYIREQLVSIARQTVLPFELILCDDVSTDNTVEIAEQFSKDTSFAVKVFRNHANLGYAQNFNKALQLCSGDIVFLCDQDDVWLPIKIESVLKCFETHPRAVLVIHDLEFCSESLEPIGQTKLERISMGGNIQRDYVVGMATAIRGDFLRQCLPIPDQHGVSHDRWLHDCAFAVGGKFVFNEVLALYRRHSQNTTASKAVNVDFVTNKWTFLWERFKEPSRVKMLREFPPSPLASWLSRQRQLLIDEGFLDASRVDTLIAQESLKTEVLRERNRLLQLPRWRRIVGVVKLLYSGGYKQFFSWRSALKDLIAI